MEVSNEIKEEIRKTQTELKNAIRVHQMWVARFQEDASNSHLKSKVKEAEKEIIVISQNQKRVVDRLRKELELYQLRLKVKNKPINFENDNRCIAQQLREHQLQHRSKNRPISLLKPSVLNEIHIKTENNNGDLKNYVSDSDSEVKLSIETVNQENSDIDGKNIYQSSYNQNTVLDSRNNFANALNKVKESFIGVKLRSEGDSQELQPSDSDSSHQDYAELSPTPSPPPLPKNGDKVSQEIFLRFLGLITPSQKDSLEKRRTERRKRAIANPNKSEFMFGNGEGGKRKKYNQFPYLQSHNDPPQTRSAKLKKQQKRSEKSSREGSPSSCNEKGWNKPSWAATLPAGLTVEPVYTSTNKVCHACRRDDVPSLLVCCRSCNVYLHTGCSPDGQCTKCHADLPDPTDCPTSPSNDTQVFRDKLAERKRLQERNIQLCVELRKLEARAATLKENLEDHHIEKRQLLADQIKTQRNLQKLLNFISQFKETSISVQSTSISDTGSEISKSNEE